MKIHAGGGTYTEQALIHRCLDGVSPNLQDARQSLDNAAAYMKIRPSVYLPAHDADSVIRLENKQPTLPAD